MEKLPRPFNGVMEDDIPTLEDGLETLVGPRGVKLSGGQMQRTAAARNDRRAGLYVFDDLGPRWELKILCGTEFLQLDAGPHWSFHIADQPQNDRSIIVLKERIQAVGTLRQLLDGCEECVTSGRRSPRAYLIYF